MFNIFSFIKNFKHNIIQFFYYNIILKKNCKHIEKKKYNHAYYIHACPHKYTHISVLETSFQTACVVVPYKNCVGVTKWRNSESDV